MKDLRDLQITIEYPDGTKVEGKAEEIKKMLSYMMQYKENSNHTWSDEDIKVLRKMYYKFNSAAIIATHLGRSVKSIENMISILKHKGKL